MYGPDRSDGGRRTAAAQPIKRIVDFGRPDVGRQSSPITFAKWSLWWLVVQRLSAHWLRGLHHGPAGCSASDAEAAGCELPHSNNDVKIAD
jgi:hypothetical protein